MRSSKKKRRVSSIAKDDEREEGDLITDSTESTTQDNSSSANEMSSSSSEEGSFIDSDETPPPRKSYQRSVRRLRVVSARHNSGDSRGIKNSLRQFLHGIDTHTFCGELDSQLLPDSWCSFGRSRNNAMLRWAAANSAWRIELDAREVDDDAIGRCPFCLLPRTLTASVTRATQIGPTWIGPECAEKFLYMRKVYRLKRDLLNAVGLIPNHYNIPLEHFFNRIEELREERRVMQALLVAKYGS